MGPVGNLASMRHRLSPRAGDLEKPGFPATDKDLVEKFYTNAENVLGTDKMKTATDMIMNLEKVNSTNELINTLIH